MRNRQLFKLGFAALSMRSRRIKLVKSGVRVDMRPDYWDDSLAEIPGLSPEDREKDFIEWPMSKLEGDELNAILEDVKKNSFSLW